MQFWLWSNKHGAWLGKRETEYVTILHLAGRFDAPTAWRLQYQANQDQDGVDFPDRVMIPVTNDYLPPAAREAMSQVGVCPDLSDYEGTELTPEERRDVMKRFESLWGKVLDEKE